jgi:Type II secretion system (T2SS), protein E, N-terminal domain
MAAMRIRIGDLLVKAGVITDANLKAALTEQGQWGGKLGDILVRMEFLTEEVLVRALSKQTGIPRADLIGDAPAVAVLEKIPPDVAEEFGVIPMQLQEDGRTLLVAMSDPLNIMVTDHLRSLTGCRIVAHIAGTSAIRNAISRWYRGEALLGDEEELVSSIRITNNSGGTVVTVPSASSKKGQSQPGQMPQQSAPPPPPTQPPPAPRMPPPPPSMPVPSAVEVLRGVEETQRRSVAALKAMVELLIEKGVFSRDEYLARVKR